MAGEVANIELVHNGQTITARWEKQANADVQPVKMVLAVPKRFWQTGPVGQKSTNESLSREPR